MACVLRDIRAGSGRRVPRKEHWDQTIWEYAVGEDAECDNNTG